MAIQPPVPEFPGSCRDYGYLMEKIGRLEEKLERLEKTDFKNNFSGIFSQNLYYLDLKVNHYLVLIIMIFS